MRTSRHDWNALAGGLFEIGYSLTVLLQLRGRLRKRRLGGNRGFRPGFPSGFPSEFLGLLPSVRHGVPGSAVAVPPGRRVAPIPLADLLVSYSAPAERLSHFQAQGQVERLPERQPAAHAVPASILVPPGLPEGWLQIPGLPWLARRLGLLWVPVVCGHHSEGGPLRGTTWFWYMSGWSGTSPTASRPKLTRPKGGQ